VNRGWVHGLQGGLSNAEGSLVGVADEGPGPVKREDTGRTIAAAAASRAGALTGTLQRGAAMGAGYEFDGGADVGGGGGGMPGSR
jgi:hypothetical protein